MRWHECVCGARSCSDYRLPNGELTNSLCVHYVAHHRTEVSSKQLAKVETFTWGEVEPYDEELQGPDLVLARIRGHVEGQLDPELETWVAWGLDVTALCRGLRGGCLPSVRGYTEARQDAESLLAILLTVSDENLRWYRPEYENVAIVLPHFHKTVRELHGDLRTWSIDALRVPGWKREAWVAPLVTLIQHFAWPLNLEPLGPAAGAAVPLLIELRKRVTGDFRSSLDRALRNICRIPSVTIHPETITLLVEVAEGTHYDPGFRIQAAKILGCLQVSQQKANTVL